MTTLSNSNYLELTFRTGLYASGYVNCTVQAIEKSIDFVQRTTTTTEIIPIDSVEIDSSEHGGPKGDKSTNCSCGWANKARVIGGRETAVNEYPFNVALTGRDDESNYTQQINVIFIDMHPGYQGNEPNFDIAVLVLEKKIEYNQFVGPVCLPNRQLNLVGDHVKVIGWGRTQSYGAGSFFVKKTNVKVLPLVECARAFPRHVDLANPHLICTYSKMKGIGLGDSGGPVVWLDPETNRYTVVGLPALVRLYLGENHYVPDMSTDVSSYIDWIAKSVDSK
ncbi:hypothetical protein AAG570_001056 [Ranatra chinensis]|uniref:Peptidase S1 domain-containing protein n=1 Tax=Ranatra chinensis TaxID=642074 RepID=A0ABD0YAT0_9HEMI